MTIRIDMRMDWNFWWFKNDFRGVHGVLIVEGKPKRERFSRVQRRRSLERDFPLHRWNHVNSKYFVSIFMKSLEFSLDSLMRSHAGRQRAWWQCASLTKADQLDLLTTQVSSSWEKLGDSVTNWTTQQKRSSSTASEAVQQLQKQFNSFRSSSTASEAVQQLQKQFSSLRSSSTASEAVQQLQKQFNSLRSSSTVA